MTQIIMPAENLFGLDNIEHVIEKCVQKIRHVLDGHYLHPHDVKELQEVIDYQKRIKKRLKLVLENPGM